MGASTAAQRTRQPPEKSTQRLPVRRHPPLDGALARRSLDVLRAGRMVPAGGVLQVQSLVGNRAVTAALRRPRVQRAVGWPKAAGWNKAARTIDAKHAMVRIPLAGLAKQNQEAAPNPAKTDEEAAGRAIVWLHPKMSTSQGVQVLVHLHGLTYRSADPFAGYRENNADPQIDEAEPARKAAKKSKQEFTNPLAGTVRDVERDRVGQQVEAMNDPQLMAVLPQGTGGAKFGKDFDADAMVTEVLDRLVTEKLIGEVPKKVRIVLSAHSAGGATAAGALKSKRTDRLGGLILFDALWGQPDAKDPSKTSSWQRDAVIDWVRTGCRSLAPTLKDTATTVDQKNAAIAALPGVRGYWESGYANTYEDLQQRMNTVVRQEIPAAYRAAVMTRFVVTKVGTSHDRIVGGSGATGVAAAPLQDALQHRKDFTAPPVARQVQRDTPGTAPPVKKTTAVKLTWKGELKNSKQLQPVLDDHPADLTADIVSKGKVIKTADTTATFEVTPSPAKQTFTVKPTASSPDDYFLSKSATVKVEADKTTEASVTLPFNRSNTRFTERTWEVTGLDVTRANNVSSATLFDKKVIGGLNDLVAGKVAAANTWFTTNVKDPVERAAISASIVSIAGRVKRAQSSGLFSNHSTGVAVDINPRQDSLQNWHIKKTDKHHATAMRLFNKVVSQPSAFDALATSLAKLFVPGVNLSAFKDFDIWKERDRDRLLEASQRFNSFFPDYLVSLATQADPGLSPTPTASSVMALSKDQLTALAAKAKKAKKADVAATLTDLAAVWFEVRAWVGGFVITNKDQGGEPKGMLRKDFDAAKAKDPTLQSKGELTGMISLHPAIVKAMTESGWSWMVDYKNDDQKDFMHFEDRQAEKDLKAKKK